MAALPVIPAARITLILTPLASTQFPQVTSDISTFVGVPSSITVTRVSRAERGRLLQGASFSFTVSDSDTDAVVGKTLRAMRIRYDSSTSIRVEIFAVPVRQAA
jgi:hypothetical protein